jgi:hypothetical protein
VTHTDLVCGEPLLSRFTAEPEGNHCVAGGVAFIVGRDRDGDGELDDDEIEQTEYECGDVVSRDVTIRSSADVAALAAIRIIEGRLEVANTELAQLSLPVLQRVGRALVITGNSQLVQIEIPQLVHVDAYFELADNRSLTAIDMARFADVNTDFEVSGNAALRDLIGLGPPSRIGGSVAIRNNAVLASLNIGGRIGPVEITGNPALAALHVFGFGGLGPVRIDGNGLDSLSLSVTSFEAKSGVLGQTVIRNNARMTSASVSADRTDRLQVSGNPSLTTVFLSVPRIDTLQVHNNPSLTTLDVSANLIDRDLSVHDCPSLHTLGLGEFQTEVTVGGSLYLSAPVELILGVASVDGDLLLDGTKLSDLSPHRPFDTVGGALRLWNNGRLHGAWFQPVGGSIELVGNAVFTAMLLGPFPFDGPFDHTVHGDVLVSGNPMLRINQFLGDITQIDGSLRIENNAQLLDTYSHGVVAVGGSVTIQNNPMLDRASLDHLRTVSHGMTIQQNAALPAISLPELAFLREWLRISDNAALRHLSVPVIASANATVTDNHVLPTCEVTALFARINGMHEQSGNDDTGVCSP